MAVWSSAKKYHLLIIFQKNQLVWQLTYSLPSSVFESQISEKLVSMAVTESKHTGECHQNFRKTSQYGSSYAVHTLFQFDRYFRKTSQYGSSENVIHSEKHFSGISEKLVSMAALLFQVLQTLCQTSNFRKTSQYGSSPRYSNA